MKVAKSKKAAKKSKATKLAKAKNIEQRRYEYEQARRKVASDRIAYLAEKYNRTQKNRDKYLARLMSLSMHQRMNLQTQVSKELERQAAAVKEHDVLKKLGVGLKLPKLVDVPDPGFDPKVASAPLRALIGSNGKAPKKVAKGGTKKGAGKVKRKTKPASVPAPEEASAE